MNTKIRFTFVAFALAMVTLDCFGQVSVTSGTYTQDFDDLAVTGTSQPWVNNVTLPGWFAYQVSNTTQGPITSLAIGQGNNAKLGWYGGAQDYSLGSGNNTGGGNVFVGVCLVNNTGASVSGFHVSYIGEQWRRSSNVAQAADTLAFSYQIFDAGTGSLSAQSWINVPSLDFISPNSSATTGADLNGNLPENQVAYSSWISGITLAEGQEIWLRWTATDNPSFSDHGLAIDDLVVTFGAIPEPAAYALGFGAFALLISMRRKRRDGRNE